MVIMYFEKFVRAIICVQVSIEGGEGVKPYFQMSLEDENNNPNSNNALYPHLVSVLMLLISSR